MKKQFDIYSPIGECIATSKDKYGEKGFFTIPEPRVIDLRPHEHINCDPNGLCRYDKKH